MALWSLVEHHSRAVYRTPVTAFRTPDGFAVLLSLGKDRDWVRNLLAADGGRVITTSAAAMPVSCARS